MPKKSTPGKFAYMRHFQRIGINATKSEKTFSLSSPSSMLKLPGESSAVEREFKNCKNSRNAPDFMLFSSEGYIASCENPASVGGVCE